MIAKQIKGKDFKAALAYNMKKLDLPPDSKALVLGSTFSSLSEKSINQEIYVSKSLRPNLKKFFYHTALSFHPSEKINNIKMKAIGETYLEKNGFNNHSYIMFRHRDADHPHMHILVSRIGFDGNVVSDSNDYYRSEKSVREIEQEFGLMVNVSSKMAMRKAVTVDEIEMIKRTGKPSEKLVLQAKLTSVLSKSRSFSDFIVMSEQEGINLQFNQASTGLGTGISYLHNGYKFKGQGLGNQYKFSQIAKILQYEQQTEHQRISTANERAVNAFQREERRTPEHSRAGGKNSIRNNQSIQKNPRQTRGFRR